MDGRPVRRDRDEGPERAHFLLEQLLEHARQNSIDMPFSANTGYVNTIEPRPGRALPRQHRDRRAPARLHALERHGHGGQGQPPSTRRTAATWAATSARLPRWPTCLVPASTTSGTPRARTTAATCLYIQGHVSPGVYARAFLEGRLTEEQLRQLPPGGRTARALSSYPHPEADARVLAVPDGVDGPGPADGASTRRAS